MSHPSFPTPEHRELFCPISRLLDPTFSRFPLRPQPHPFLGKAQLPTCLPPGSGPLTHLSVAEVSRYRVGNNDVGAHVFLHEVRVQGVMGVRCVTGGPCRQKGYSVRMKASGIKSTGLEAPSSSSVADQPAHPILTVPIGFLFPG